MTDIEIQGFGHSSQPYLKRPHFSSHHIKEPLDFLDHPIGTQKNVRIAWGRRVHQCLPRTLRLCQRDQNPELLRVGRIWVPSVDHRGLPSAGVVNKTVSVCVCVHSDTVYTHIHTFSGERDDGISGDFTLPRCLCGTYGQAIVPRYI